MGNKRVYGIEDWKAAFNLSCCVLGLGSLGLARCFSIAGPVYTTIALLIMCVVNIYSTAAISKCMLRAPVYVQTYGDLGEFILGPAGRYSVVCAQFGTCLMVPIAFLVLGGSQILPNVFHDVWPHASANHFIPLMALCLLPIVLIRTLKEAAWVALIGAAGTFLGDFVAVVDSYINATHYTHAQVAPTPMSVATVFGTLSLAYGAGIVIPGIQRDLKRPENMPSLITIALLIITGIYFAIGITGFVQYGCVAPHNLLRSMENRTAEILAQLFFFAHIAIAYAVILNPALYIFERSILGFYQVSEEGSTSSCQKNYEKMKTPGRVPLSECYEKGRESMANGDLQDRASYVQDKRSIGGGAYSGELDLVHNSPRDGQGDQFPIAARLKSYALRTTVVSIQVLVAMLLQSCFDEFADFIGATSMTFSCIILPVAMYLKMFYHDMKWPERVACIIIMIVCCALGLLCATKYMMDIISKIDQLKPFHSAIEDDDAALNTQFCRNIPLEVQ